MIATLIALLAAQTAPAPAPAEELSFERLLLCQSYHEIWQWDEANAGRKVPEDFEWYKVFRDRLRAAGAAKGIDRYKIAELGNAQARMLRPKLTPEQNEDWARCVAETGWKPDPSGKTIN
jgi:hypothetical protein